jgi:adenine-specific DNA-methyltransferase
VSALEHKRANEKRELMYAFQAYRNGKIVLNVTYSEKGRKTKADEILRAIKEKGFAVAEATLERACRLFEKQSEVDYFINKNAKAFLQEQFDLWFYQYVFSGESAWTEKRLQQLQAIKTIAYRIIAFIAQFEDELVRIWNKPKFVRNSHYIITLDKISDADLRRRLYAHPGMTHQLAEWQTLGMVDAAFELTLLTATDLVGQPRHPHYQYLPLDTRYFPDLELAILALFDDLDAALDGWLIHSENYQALNTLLPKFRGKVNVIYIDPPYNTDASPIIYVNSYRNSSWLSMMNNRLALARTILAETGIICTTIDDSQQKELHQLLEIIFGKDSTIGTVAVRVNPSGRPTQTGFALQHEYAIFTRNNDESVIKKMERTEDQQKRFSDFDEKGSFEWRNLRREGSNSDRAQRRRLYYPIIVNDATIRIPQMHWNERSQTWEIDEKISKPEVIIYPIDDDEKEKTWRWGYQRILADPSLFMAKKTKNGKINIYYKNHPDVEGTVPPTLWVGAKYSATEHGTGTIKHLFGDSVFSYPKSIYAVEDCISIAGLKEEETQCLDFFGGSGTTAHAVINLNRVDEGGRKYILVEMGEHFNTVILPRIKKVVFSGKWKDGKAVLNNGDGEGSGKGISHFAKYYQLEQYEETLRRARYDDAPLLAGADAYNAYVFLRDLKLLEAVRLDKAGNKVQVNLTTLYDGIDLAETLSCVTGKGIKRITQESVEFQDGTSASLTDPDWQLVKPLIWW